MQPILAWSCWKKRLAVRPWIGQEVSGLEGGLCRAPVKDLHILQPSSFCKSMHAKQTPVDAQSHFLVAKQSFQKWAGELSAACRHMLPERAQIWDHCTVQCWNEKCLLPPLKVLCIVGEVLSHAMTLMLLRRMCDLILSHLFWPQLSVSMQWGRIWELWLGVWTNLMPWLLFSMILWFSGILMVKQHEDVHMPSCQTLQRPSSTLTWYTQTGNTLCRPHDAYLIFILCCKCCIVGKYARELAVTMVAYS